MQAKDRTSAFQLELPWMNADALQCSLEQQTGFAVDLTLTDNSSTMMYVRSLGGNRRMLRLHYMFLTAPPTVLRALAEWVRSPRRKRSDGAIEQFVAVNGHMIRSKTRTRQVQTTGKHHDLRAIADEVNREFFDGGIDATITWGRQPARGRRRSIRFGSYTASDHVVRIHPALDQDFVPGYFVRYIIFHEMLHAHLGAPKRPSGRRAVHGRAFLERERAYPDYARAVAWQDNPANLRRLLR